MILRPNIGVQLIKLKKQKGEIWMSSLIAIQLFVSRSKMVVTQAQEDDSRHVSDLYLEDCSN